MAASPFGGAARRVAGRVARGLGVKTPGMRTTPNPIEQYLAGGRVPWSEGYSKYRRKITVEALADADLVAGFKNADRLPAGYGARLDERVIEYPWVLSRLSSGSSIVLDAGSTLSYPYTLAHPALADKRLVVVNLAPPAYMAESANVSYLFDDLRDLMLRDGVFDTVVCISTLEHIGLDNTQLYSTESRFAEHNLDGYRPALAELRRVLKPGGNLLLTVPFGAAEDHGWLQQFDHAGIRRIIDQFCGNVVAEVYYRYSPDGWQIASAEACASERYFNVHAASEPAPDGAAAARAVCCLELVRS